MVHSHSADEEVVFDELGVVIGKVYHQVDMTIADQAAQERKKKKKHPTMTKHVFKHRSVHLFGLRLRKFHANCHFVY